MVVLAGLRSGRGETVEVREPLGAAQHSQVWMAKKTRNEEI
jgi:hypothetical protein